MLKKLLLLSVFLLHASFCLGAVVEVQSVDQLKAADTDHSITISSVASGNLIVTSISIDKDSGAITVPTNFTLTEKEEGTNISMATAYKVSTGGETSVQWNWTESSSSIVWVGEYSGLETTGVFDTSIDHQRSANQSISTQTSAETAQADELAIAAVVIDSRSSRWNSNEPTWTNSFVETSNNTDPAGGDPGLAVSTKILSSVGTVETTAAWTGISDESAINLQMFKIADAEPVTRRIMLIH